MSSCLMNKTGHECFKNILDQFPVPVVIAGFGIGKIFYMNEHAQKLLRTKGETPEFVNTTDFYVDPGRRKHFLSLVTSAGFLKEYEIEFIDSLGVRFWGMVSSKRIVYNNEDAILSTIFDISLRKKLEEKLVYSSSHDFLTGVFNRRHFSSVMTSEVVRSKRYSTSLSLVMIDLDNFKIVNDVHGHIVGDEILKHFCTIVRENLRQTDTLDRFGGEEFAVLLPETDLIGAEKFAERVRSTVSLAEFLYENKSISFSISSGVASLAVDEDAERLLKRCDDALLVAKMTGKNKVVVCSSQIL